MNNEKEYPMPDLANLDIYSPNDNGYNMANMNTHDVFNMPDVDYDATINNPNTYLGYEKTAKALAEQIPFVKQVLQGDEQVMQQSFNVYAQHNDVLSYNIAKKKIVENMIDANKPRVDTTLSQETSRSLDFGM